MTGLYLRGNVWWFRFHHRGKQRFLSTQEQDEAKAIVIARQIASVPDRYLSGQTALEVELAEFLEHRRRRGVSEGWLKNQRLYLEAFFRDFHITAPHQITTARVSEWIDDFTNPNTAHARHGLMDRFCRWLVDHRRLHRNPCLDVIRPRVRPTIRRRFLSRTECASLLAACHNPDLRTAIMLALHAGLRKGECLEASPAWIDLPGRLLHVTGSADWQPKDRDNRTIPITEPLAAHLATIDLRQPYLVAPHKRKGSKIYRWEMRKPWEELKAACHMPDVVFHDLRRTFASLLVSAGVSIYKVAKWLGDGVEVVETHYGHLSPADADINRAWTDAV